MSNRHHRRADLAKIKRNTPGALLTYLVEPDEPGSMACRCSRLRRATGPAGLEDGRHCIICSSSL